MCNVCCIESNIRIHFLLILGHDSIVTILLTAGADPTLLDVRGRPPYFLAKGKEVRDAYRRVRGRTEGNTYTYTSILIKFYNI